MKHMRPLPPIGELRARLSVDADGVLRWVNGPRAGRVASSENGNGYLTIRFNGRKLYAHRVVQALSTGLDPFPLLIDHEHGKRDANAPTGLRPVTNAQNLRVRTKKNSNNSSGHTGIYWHSAGKRWAAGFADVHLGLFVNKQDAVAAREAYMKGRQ